MVNVLVRVDSNSTTGYGHFSRCLNLCSQWLNISKKYKFTFCGNYTEFAQDVLRDAGFAFISLEDNAYVDCDLEALKDAQILVLDSYMLSQDVLDRYTSANVFSVLISDVMELDYSLVSCVINFRLNAENEFKYNSNFSCLGIKFLIVNPLLDIVREANVNKRVQATECKRLLLFFGGGFSDNEFVSKLVGIIHSLNPVIQVFHLSSDSLDLGDNYFPLPPGKRFYSLIHSCDTLITGGGLIKYEGCYSIMPVGSFSSSSLQFEDSHQLSNASLHKNLGWINNLMTEQTGLLLKRLLLDKKTRLTLISQCTKQFDAFPTRNLITQIIHQYEKL